ncbi:GNAT family N-acetyltransferase [Roseovarius sp. MMSF_3281]|uniref:GNAT family N-acetyltransferase n=1 Tax=Roseovarius sp. MMSF_3281 TaxID=3046694 RepID=UPI00273FB9E3|nr:GNAT family N-acetyltransferase [Roseovarius sp. MMSF_3281]
MTGWLRPAGHDDISALADILRAARAELHPGQAHHAGQCAHTLRRLIGDRMGAVWVAEARGAAVGVMVAQAGAGLWCPGVQADCVLRWVDPAQRGHWARPMQRAFEAWAREIGADVLTVSQTGREAEQFYRAAGYAPAERIYLKGV